MIGEKIIKIMENIKPIEKTEVDEEKNFKYAKAEDVVAMVRPLLVEYKVAIIPKEVKSFIQQGNKVYVTMKYQIIDIEDENKDCIEVEMPGSGYDEKGRAIFGALTGAYRYVMQQSFAIPVIEEKKDESEDRNNKPENNNEVIGFSEDMQEIQTSAMSPEDIDSLFDLPNVS